MQSDNPDIQWALDLLKPDPLVQPSLLAKYYHQIPCLVGAPAICGYVNHMRGLPILARKSSFSYFYIWFYMHLWYRGINNPNYEVHWMLQSSKSRGSFKFQSFQFVRILTIWISNYFWYEAFFPTLFEKAELRKLCYLQLNAKLVCQDQNRQWILQILGRKVWIN